MRLSEYGGEQMVTNELTCCDTCLDRDVEGAVNFRDLGGLPAAGGTIRPGVIFRSGITRWLTPDALVLLTDRYRLRTVIDLRTTQELEDDGVPDWPGAGIVHLHLPLLATTSGVNEELRRQVVEGGIVTFDWAALYGGWLADAGPAFRAVFQALARPDALPAVFHCSGGRDRTGVTAALLLGMLGVPDEAIARDYALTGVHLRRASARPERLARQAQMMGVSREQMARIGDTTEEAMQGFLALLRGRYGSVESYLDSIGVEDSVRATLRDRLIAPAGGEL
jgi:protein-tyrosine phosphatase